jgi:hypothetical protein
VKWFDKVVGLLALALTLDCGRGTAPSAGPAGQGTAAASATAEASNAAALDPMSVDLWNHAKEGDPEDVMRLALHEGSVGLMERGEDHAWRTVAVRAMAYADGLGGLAWLAEIGASGEDEGALLALDGAVEIASRPRRADDPEDALELRAGCDRLLAIAREAQRPAQRRVLAIRALRMLADRGCVKPADIPTDLDAR